LKQTWEEKNGKFSDLTGLVIPSSTFCQFTNTSTSLFAITLLSCFENYNDNTKVKCHERICHARYDDTAINFFDQLSDQMYHEASVRGNAEYPTTSIALTSKVAMQRGINSSVLGIL